MEPKPLLQSHHTVPVHSSLESLLACLPPRLYQHAVSPRRASRLSSTLSLCVERAVACDSCSSALTRWTKWCPLCPWLTAPHSGDVQAFWLLAPLTRGHLPVSAETQLWPCLICYSESHLSDCIDVPGSVLREMKLDCQREACIPMFILTLNTLMIEKWKHLRFHSLKNGCGNEMHICKEAQLLHHEVICHLQQPE